VCAVMLHVVNNECSLCITTSKTSVFIRHAKDGLLLRRLDEPSIDPSKISAIQSIDLFHSPGMISPNDVTLVTGRGEGNISIWDVATGYRVRSLVGGHSSEANIFTVAHMKSRYENDRSFPIIISGGSDNRICKWNLTTPAARYRLDADMSEIYWLKKFQPNNNSTALIIVASSDGLLRLVDAETFQVRSIVNIPKILSIESYCCSTIAVTKALDGQYPIIVTSDFYQSTYIWNFQTSRYHEIRGEYVSSMEGRKGPVLVSHNDGDKTLTVWNIYSGEKLMSTDEFTESTTGHMGLYQRQDDPDPMVVVGTRSGKLVLYNARNGKIEQSISAHNRSVYYCRVY